MTKIGLGIVEVLTLDIWTEATVANNGRQWMLVKGFGE